MSPPEPLDPQQPSPPAPRRAALLEVLGAVFWSFFGVRKHSAMTRDAATIRPLQVIIVGVMVAATLVLGLAGLVHVIMASSR